MKTPSAWSAFADVSEADIARFWNKVKKGDPDECWEWIAGKSGSGYGSFTVHGAKGRKIHNAHKLAWIVSNSRPVPKGLVVMHSCDNKACVNPGHLSIGTPFENIRDCRLRGRKNPAVGERHSRAKMTADIVRAIRLEYETNAVSIRELQDKYGFTWSSTYAAATRRSWKCVE